MELSSLFKFVDDLIEERGGGNWVILYTGT